MCQDIPLRCDENQSETHHLRTRALLPFLKEGRVVKIAHPPGTTHYG